MDIRPLGTSGTIFVENNSCIFATGCNIAVRSDMARRTLICRLDPNMERPETRQFKRNPFKEVLADRGKYIAAAMTIARAYLEAGEPSVNAEPLASFEAWSRFVQRPLVWLGMEDPVKSLAYISSEDPEQAGLLAILEAWHKAVGGEITTVKKLRDKASDELKEAIIEAVGCSKDGEFDSVKFGHWLRRMNGKIAGELKLTKAGGSSHSKQKLWRVNKFRRC